MSISGSVYVQKIEAQKAEKAGTSDLIRDLKEELAGAQHIAYTVLSQLNGEIANKYFKEVNHEISFTNRINSAVVLMENEIKRLELGMEMPEYVDPELDASIEELRSELSTWEAIRGEIRNPVQDSALYKTSVDFLERNNREDFPVVENLMELQQADEKFLEDANTLAESVQSIVHRSELEMEKRVQLLDAELRENISTIAESLQGQGAELKAQMQAGRSQHREELGSMYAELLAKFLQTTETSCHKISATYTKLERRKAPLDGQADGKTPKAADAAAPPPPTSSIWKSELYQLYLTALKEDRQRRELEDRLDQVLIQELDDSKISVLDHGMDEEYLATLMDKLTALHLESSEIDLRRMRVANS